MLKPVVVLSGLLLFGSQAAAQVKSGSETWGPAPAGLPAGAQLAVMYGDPGKPGLFEIRLKMPAGYTIPPHWHPTVENLTILSGDLTVGMGDKLAPETGAKLRPGDYISLEPNMHHFAVSQADTVLQMTSEGPFAITYVNPADDPRAKK